MLGELRRLHDELEHLISRLADIASTTGGYDEAALTSVRWRLSRASRARAKLIDEAILPYLFASASGSERELLNALRATIRESTSLSFQHVAGWSAPTIAADWHGYCRASAAMRDEMRSRISSERRTLYPLLERACRGNIVR